MKVFIAISVLISVCAIASAQGNTKTALKNPASAKAADEGYEIKVTLTPYKNCWVYLGSYYGKNKILADSAWFNEKSEAVYKGDKKLSGGIYFFVTPSHTLL